MIKLPWNTKILIQGQLHAYIYIYIFFFLKKFSLHQFFYVILEYI